MRNAVLVLSSVWTAALAFAPTPRIVPALRQQCLHRCHPVVAALPEMQDDLKPRFSRGAEEETKTSFAPDRAPAQPKEAERATAAEAAKVSKNQQLLAEIRALQPEKPAAEPAKDKTVDLNGIQPAFLLLGAGSYGVVSVLAWQFTQAAGEYFAAHPMDDAFYVVARLSSVARYVVVGLGGLGAGVTCIASLGQLALAVQVQNGIMKGELDPTAERIDPYGGRKAGELEKMLGLMLGDKEAGNKNDPK
jgi:hypothetical protein